MPLKLPAMMAAWFAMAATAKEGESGTVINSPTALATQQYEAVRSNAILFFTSYFQLNQSEHQGGGFPSADRLKRLFLALFPRLTSTFIFPEVGN